MFKVEGGGTGTAITSSTDVSAKSITLAQTTGNIGVRLETGARLVFNGATADQYLFYNGFTIRASNGFGAVGQITADSGFVVSSGSTYQNSNNTVTLIGNTSDGAAAIGVKLSNGTTLSNATAKLVSIQNNGTEKAAFSKDGKLQLDATDSSGTPGAVTINKPSGQVAIASGASSVVVTNSCVSATSVVLAVMQDNTDNISIRSVVPAAGSFTINTTAVTTAARKVGFVVFN